MKRLPIIVFLLLFWSIPLFALEVILDEIHVSSGDPNLIREYHLARAKYLSADRQLVVVRNGFIDDDATFMEYVQAKEDRATAVRGLHYAEAALGFVEYDALIVDWMRSSGVDRIMEEKRRKAKEREQLVPFFPLIAFSWKKSAQFSQQGSDLVIIPALSRDIPPVVNKSEEILRQWWEAMEIRQILPQVKMRLGSGRRCRKRLQKLVSQFKGQAAEADICLALGDLAGDEHKTALKYYKRAIQCRMRSGPRDWAHREAWKKATAIYEQNGAYQEAVRDLRKLKVSDSNGYGETIAGAERALKICELELHFVPEGRVFDAFWKEIGSVNEISEDDIDDIAHSIVLLYGKERETRLKGTVEQILKETKPRDNSCVREKALSSWLAREVKVQLEFQKIVDSASPPQVIELLNSDKITHLRIISKVTECRQCGLSQYYSWREEYLVEKLTALPPAETISALSSLENVRLGHCVLFRLGKIGSPEAIAYFMKMIKENSSYQVLRDYYFCLLLTNDREAAEITRRTAAGGKEINRLAAKWALENYPCPSLGDDAELW